MFTTKSKIFFMVTCIAICVGVVTYMSLTPIKPYAAHTVETQNDQREIQESSPSAASSGGTRQQTVARPTATSAYGVSASAERDLWAYANAMRKSTDPSKLVEARHAVAECRSLTLLGNEMASFISGGKSRIGGPLTPERQLAYADLIARCSGFRTASPTDIQSLRDDLSRQMQSYAPALLESSTVASFSAQQKLDLVFSDSASAIAQGLPAVARDWARSKGFMATGDENRNDMFKAAFLAACDLGTDCSSTGFDAEMQCVLSGDCIDASAREESGLSSERKQQISEYRSQLVNAIKAKDLSTLGLHVSNMGDAPIKK